ncbi:hypothetical protein AB3662_26655 [Sorangium cellulosum]|uniref:hypothetical protein n=1 Tax=Sorangium cellulosum TaxID=56 RepID=UPI003D9A61EE
MRRVLKNCFIAAASVLAIAAAAEPASARSAPATYGKALLATDASCFSLSSYGTVTYASPACADTRTFQFPLVTDSAGWFTARVYAFGDTSSNNVGCQAMGMSNGTGTLPNWVSWWAPNPVQYLPSFGSNQTISTTSYVPASGGAFVNCYVNPGGRLNVVEW